jgi:hypothetical protein
MHTWVLSREQSSWGFKVSTHLHLVELHLYTSTPSQHGQPNVYTGDRCDVSKYRPVSLLTSFSKIFEMVMQNRILKHLTKYNILSTEQYGFRIGLKTDNAIYQLKTEILNVMNNELLVEGIS